MGSENMRVYTHSSYSYVRVAEIPKSEIEKIDFATTKEPKESVQSFYDRQTKKPDVLTNLGFFALSTGDPSFNFVDDGKTMSSNKSYKWGFGILGDNDIRYGELNSKEWRDFVSGYPVLLDNGRKCSYDYASEIGSKARRTAIGYNDDTVFVVCVENPGMDFPSLQDLMINVGCKYAINLDGGGSTKMIANGEVITNNYTNRAVDSVLAVYLKEKKVIYRCQVGAFGIRANANALLAKIKSLGMQYSGAFVKKVCNVYKVQVGAFTNKTFADNMVADLKSNGYDAFIVTD